jgi:hypothetical protein
VIPFLQRIDHASKVLVAGCGGGFDVFAGVPLAQRLTAQGKEVVFASFSFTNLWLCVASASERRFGASISALRPFRSIPL